MSKYKVSVDPSCVGCGLCATISVNFDMKEINGEMKAVAKKGEIGETEITEHKEAEDACPVSAIKIEEIKN